MPGPRAAGRWRPRPRLASQHAAASDKSHTNATCRLLSDQALDAKASARHGPGFGTRSRLSTAVSPASLLAPPTSDYTRATLSNFKQRKTDLWCHVILQVSPSPCPPFLKGYLCSTSQSRLPLLLDSSSPLQSCFCACHQVHSHLLAINTQWEPFGLILLTL